MIATARAPEIRRRRRALATLTASASFLLLALAPPALAGKQVSGWIGAPGPGTLGAEFDSPAGIAVNETGAGGVVPGTLYVADSANNRIQRFSATGDFERAWGIDVVQAGGTGDTAGGTFEVCTVAAQCQAGQPSGGDGTAAGNGGLGNPQGIAVDQDAGLVYVTVRANNRVNAYDPDGSFQRTFGFDVDPAGAAEAEVCEAPSPCKAGVAGEAAGQLGADVGRLDVSKPGGDPATGSVFVADTGNRRVAEFALDGTFTRAWGWNVDSAGGSGQFEICTADCQAGVAPSPFGSAAEGQFPSGHPVHVAVDAAGIVYATSHSGGFFGSPRLDRYDSTQSAAAGLLVGSVGESFTALGLDSATDHLLGATDAGVEELDTTAPGGPATADTHIAGSGIAVDGVGSNEVSTPSGHLYAASTTAGHRVYIADQDGAPPPPMTVTSPTAVTSDSATFTGTVDPNGFPTDYRFEHSSDGGEAWTAVKPDEPVGDGEDPVAVTDDATGLDPGTEYLVRLVATPGFGNDPAFSAEVAFETEAVPPTVTTLPNPGASDTAATLGGEIATGGAETTYHFEYGTTTAYGNQAPVPEASAGDGPGVHTVHEQLDGLSPETTYHYRLVATNEKGTVEGDDETFTTRRAAAKPPRRGYEMVSPPDKISGVGVGNYALGDLASAYYGWAARDGERYAVMGNWGDMLLDGAFAYGSDWAFAERTRAGWRSHSPFTHPNAEDAPHRLANIYAASDDLSLTSWSSNGGHFTPFLELAEMIPFDWGAPHLSDWAGRWEAFAPTDVAQGDPESGPAGTYLGGAGHAVSADGSTAVLTGGLRGLAGPADPTLDLPPDTTMTYVNDVSAGLSDSFPGAGIREPVGVCDAGTEIPSRQEVAPGVFNLSGRGCEGELVDPRGVSIGKGNTANVVSRDGSRVFFMSPHDGSPVGVFGAERFCAGTGAETACPAQLYVRDQAEDGSVTTRWVSRPEIADQEASLLGPTIFEDATPEGDVVFFRTPSPLTADDPNGGAPVPGGVTTGSWSPDSWDLYRYDLASGELTRISAGPTGTGDANNQQPQGKKASLRFASADGHRAYFVTSAPLPGVPAAANGTTTTPYDGPVSSITPRNFYLYEDVGTTESWRFVAQLPAGSDLGECATTGAVPGQPLNPDGNQVDVIAPPNGDRNCVTGTADGSFVTFLTDGKLVANDPGAETGDVYGFDATADELIRLSRPQGGIGESYKCADEVVSHPELRCYGDGGLGFIRGARPRLGVVVEPADPSERIAVFQSKSRLVPGDSDDEYDVYQWRNGDLSLLSAGTETPAYYSGNSRDGEDVFLMTRDRLSWRDFDDVHDIYDARIGGGFPEPVPPPVCAILAGGCETDTAPKPEPADPATPEVRGPGNAEPKVPARSCERLERRSKRADRRMQKARKRFKRVKRRTKRASGKQAERLERKVKRKRKRFKKAKRKARRKAAKVRECHGSSQTRVSRCERLERKADRAERRARRAERKADRASGERAQGLEIMADRRERQARRAKRKARRCEPDGKRGEA